MLTLEELDDFSAIGVAVDARHVPDDAYERALAERRVKGVTYERPGMGDLCVYWEPVTVMKPAALRHEEVVVPRGETVREPTFEERRRELDEWGFFVKWREKDLCEKTPADAFRPECARLIARCEERRDPERAFRGAALLSVLRAVARGRSFDDARRDELLARHDDARLSTLVVRTRRVFGDARAIMHAALDAAPAPARDALRWELYRHAVRVIRGRAAVPLPVADPARRRRKAPPIDVAGMVESVGRSSGPIGATTSPGDPREVLRRAVRLWVPDEDDAWIDGIATRALAT